MHRALFLDHCITSLESLLLFSERCLESTVRDHNLKEGRSEPALKAADVAAGFAYHIEFLQIVGLQSTLPMPQANLII